MRYINQTNTDKGTGDCVRAVVASILSLDSIEQVPHFILYKEGMWFVVYKAFMRIFGFEWEGVSNNPEDLKKENSINGYFIASVPSRTHGGHASHAVIIDMKGKVVHDPNPNKLWQDAILDFNDPHNTIDIFKWEKPETPVQPNLMKKRVVRYKIYTDRARWYVGYVQLLLMVAIFFKTSGIHIPLWGYPIMLVCIVSGFILFGYLETKLGFLKEEQDKYSRENPMMQEILKLLKELKSEQKI